MFTRVRRHLNRIVKRRRPLSSVPGVDSGRFLFICGLHRSGTSVLHRVLQDSPEISGLADTGAPEDEGQHLQSVVPPAYKLGGPGRFAFHPASSMTESSVRDLARERDTLLREWGAYYDLGRRLLIEKSPPNLVRSRYLQALFPDARFLFLLRHPVVVSMATEKYAPGASRLELMLHWHVAHEIMRRDLPHLRHALVVHYEDLADDFETHMARIRDFVGIAPFTPTEAITDQNSRYLGAWERSAGMDVDIFTRTAFNPGQPAFDHGYLLEAPYRRAAPAGPRLASA
jgi:hypothetical protein